MTRGRLCKTVLRPRAQTPHFQESALSCVRELEISGVLARRAQQTLEAAIRLMPEADAGRSPSTIAAS